ncbi:MAG: YesL family protein [Catonella sp.]|uniref:YesL family protein n=1 Tax=Catonella sp. TaxID=2382125 RepID=UPI003F9EE7DE
MGNLFNVNNVFFRFMGKLFDVVALNIVFIIVCIPIVTIGPAISALYYASVKSIRRDRSYPVKEFFKGFKRDFKQSFIVGLIMVIAGIILYIDVKFSVDFIQNSFTYMRYIYFIIAAVLAFIMIYIYPLISRFSLRLSGLFKLSFYLSIRHFLTTIVSIILLFGGFVLVYISAGLALLIVPVTVTLLISIMMEKVLIKCMNLVKTDDDYENKDQWYLE